MHCAVRLEGCTDGIEEPEVGTTQRDVVVFPNEGARLELPSVDM